MTYYRNVTPPPQPRPQAARTIDIDKLQAVLNKFRDAIGELQKSVKEGEARNRRMAARVGEVERQVDYYGTELHRMQLAIENLECAQRATESLRRAPAVAHKKRRVTVRANGQEVKIERV